MEKASMQGKFNNNANNLICQRENSRNTVGQLALSLSVKQQAAIINKAKARGWAWLFSYVLTATQALLFAT